ncbi:MAG TPA: phage tail protein [Nakamurella sp.]|nr:phage tail protein [Nakamurella sp.]
MRGLVPGLASPYPLGEILPSLYREDYFAQNLCAGLDEVLAPVIATLDSLPAYLDPATSPDDMLGWLAGWMGIVLDGHQSAERQRELVQVGVELLQWRGTARGVRAAVGALFDAPPEIVESGGASWSADAGSSLPGSAQTELLVRLQVSDPETFDVRRLEALVAMIKPAHVPHRVEVFGAG